MAISSFRVIQPQILIEKDGAYQDISRYCSRLSIDAGNTTQAGTGTQAIDGIASVLECTIKNDVDNNFNPLDQNSVWNKENFYGNYSPFLWDNKNIIVKASTPTPTEKTQLITGNGSNIYPTNETNIIPNSVNIKRVFGILPLINDIGSYTFEENYYGKPFGSWTFEELYSRVPSSFYSSINVIGNNFDFGDIIPSGVIMEIQYQTADINLKTLFQGVLGDNISPSKYEVNLSVRDRTKLMLDSIIDLDDSNLRTYTEGGTISSPTFTDSKTSIVYSLGIPIEIFIQNFLNDILGEGTITLYTPTSPLFVVKPKKDLLQYKNVWSVLQELTSNIGWYIGYRYRDETNGIVLTLMEPPREKITEDWEFDYTTDFYVATGKLDFASVRNYIKLYFKDLEGTEKSVSVLDSDSVTKYGKKTLIISQTNTTGITTEEEAAKMAQKILFDLKDAKMYSTIEMPLFVDIRPFDTFKLNYPSLSSTSDIYAVESIRHDLDFEGKKFRTTLTASSKVTGGLARWKEIATRPGKYQPATANKLTEAYKYKPPTGLSITGNAIIFSGTAVNVTATVSYAKPILDNPVQYEIQWKISTFPTYTNAKITKNTTEKIILDSNVQYTFRVRSIAKNGDAGNWSNAVNFTPTTSILSVTDADLSGERDDTIYIKTQVQLETWINSVATGSYVTPDYSKVIITSGSYTIGTLFSPKTTILIDKSKFEISTIGAVYIEWFYSGITRHALDIKADYFYITGSLKIVMLSGSDINFLNFTKKTSGIKGVLNIDGLNYIRHLSTINKVSTFINQYNDMSEVNMIITNSYIENLSSLFYNSTYLGRFFLQNCTLIWSYLMSENPYFIFLSNCNNIYILNNSLPITNLGNEDYYFTQCDYVCFKGNKLEMNLIKSVDNRRIIKVEEGRKGWSVENNVVINNTPDIVPGLKFLGSYISTPTEAFSVSFNTAIDNYKNFKAYDTVHYDGATTITLPTNDSARFVNTSTIRINNIQRTVTGRPASNQITINSSLELYEGDYGMYVDASSVQWVENSIYSAAIGLIEINNRANKMIY